MRLTKVRGKVVQRLRSLLKGANQHLDPAFLIHGSRHRLHQERPLSSSPLDARAPKQKEGLCECAMYVRCSSHQSAALQTVCNQRCSRGIRLQPKSSPSTRTMKYPEQRMCSALTAFFRESLISSPSEHVCLPGGWPETPAAAARQWHLPLLPPPQTAPCPDPPWTPAPGPHRPAHAPAHTHAD